MSTTAKPDGTVAPSSGGSSGVFSRSASGLIRVAGSWDVFIFNVGLVSVGIAIAFNQYYGPSLYPGAAPAISTLLAALGMCVVAVTFYLWSVIFPRSGGVYVILSRTTNPAVAFVFSLLETVILLYYGALAASLLVQVGLASFFATVGSVGGNDTLVQWAADVSKPRGVFWIGTGVLLLAGLLLATGTRRYFTVQKVMFVIALVATGITVIVKGGQRAMVFAGRAPSAPPGAVAVAPGWLVLGVVAGAALPVQGALNAQLRTVLQQPIAVALVSFLVAALTISVLLVVLLALRRTDPVRWPSRAMPWWGWLGGLCAATYVTGTFLLIPAIGAAVTVALTVTGQQLASAAVDAGGLFRLPRRPLTRVRAGGLALLVAGSLVVQLT